MRRTETEWAKRNLELAGLMSPESDYNGMIGEAVCKLLDVHAAEGHSGASHYRTLELFNIVARGKTALTKEFWQERFEDFNAMAKEHGVKPYTEEEYSDNILRKPS